ncbi:MAG: putative Ig domain-containing protein, partial [Bryobacteraceae bacterium]
MVGLVLSWPGWATGAACAAAGASATGSGSIPELPSAMVGMKYLAKADVSIPFGEAVAPLTYSCTIAAGSWLQVDPVTGALSGTPQSANTAGSALTVSVRDSATPVHSYSQDYFLRVQDGAREIQLIPRVVEGATLI